jgi:hypothetical protein
MNLHFVTSISKDYWDNTAKYCIPTWDLPGKVTIFIEQRHGDLEWLKDLPFKYQLMYAPDLELDELMDRAKVLKFWGKSCAQIYAVREREPNERIVWIDADVEQVSPVPEQAFTFNFKEPLAMLNSRDDEDCWETGVVVFNQQYEKLSLVMKKYEQAWHDSEILNSLWKPYDAQVLGYIANDRGFKNLCNAPCKNIDALKNSHLGTYFTHWINKDNKSLLKRAHEPENCNDLSQNSSESKESRED